MSSWHDGGHGNGRLRLVEHVRRPFTGGGLDQVRGKTPQVVVGDLGDRDVLVVAMEVKESIDL